MVLFPDSKTFLNIGVLSIKWYAVFIMTGTILSCYVAYRQLKKNGYGPDLIEDLFTGCMLFGIIGARLWFCAFYDFGHYISHPIDILKIYQGGLAIQGGLFAGGLFAFIYARKKKIDFMRGADACFPNLLLAQSIGRWGNFMNQEAFGGVVSEEFYRFFPEFIKDRMFINGAYHAPTFLYESIGNFIGWILIWFVYRNSKTRQRGDLAYAYLLWYGLVRVFVEAQRTDSLMFGSLRMAQVISILFIVIGTLGIFGVFRKFEKKEKPILLFDLDGTLLDTEPAIIETYRRLFEKYTPEQEFDREKQLSVLGPALSEMFPKFFPGHDVDEMIAEYREINHNIHPEYVKPMENVKVLLENLKQQGYRMAIVSSKKQDICRYGLSLFGMEDYFEFIVGETDVKQAKPSPEGILMACQMMGVGHDNVVYIGDSATDMMAAHNAGVYSIGYIFNQERKQKLVDSKPNRLIDDLIEIEEILKEDHSWTYNMM